MSQKTFKQEQKSKLSQPWEARNQPQNKFIRINSNKQQVTCDILIIILLLFITFYVECATIEVRSILHILQYCVKTLTGSYKMNVQCAVS